MIIQWGVGDHNIRQASWQGNLRNTGDLQLRIRPLIGVTCGGCGGGCGVAIVGCRGLLGSWHIISCFFFNQFFSYSCVILFTPAFFRMGSASTAMCSALVVPDDLHVVVRWIPDCVVSVFRKSFSSRYKYFSDRGEIIELGKGS